MKIHKMISSMSPRYGTTLQALCGAKVPSAVPLALDDDFQPTNSIEFCKDCQARSKYVAWITSGEESKQMEGEA